MHPAASVPRKKRSGKRIKIVVLDTLNIWSCYLLQARTKCPHPSTLNDCPDRKGLQIHASCCGPPFFLMPDATKEKEIEDIGSNQVTIFVEAPAQSLKGGKRWGGL